MDYDVEVISLAAEDRVDACDLCKRKTVSEKLTWSDLSESRLCPECLAEEESCGCAD